jgi:WD40 repeat protein
VRRYLQYKAFISYSHAADGKLAPVLQSALHKFAKPLFKLRAIRTFRDETALALTPKLWPTIEEALQKSEYFLLLASPLSATSYWVQREVEWWWLNRAMDKMLIVVTESQPLVPDDVDIDFNLVRDKLVPKVLRSSFTEPPLYLDLRWARKEEHLTLGNGKFQDQIATISAALRATDKDVLIGEDLRAHKRVKRLTWSAIISLTVLFLCVMTGAYLALHQENIAISRQLAAQAVNHFSDQIDLGLLLSLEANRKTDRLDVKSSLLTGLNWSPHLVAFMRNPGGTVESVEFSADRRAIATGADGHVVLWDVDTQKQVRELVIPETSQSSAVALTPDGEILVAAANAGNIMRWNARTMEPLGQVATGYENAVDRIAFRPHSSVAAAASVLDDDVVLLDVKTGRIGKRLAVGEQGVSAVAFSPDGTKLAASDGKKAIVIWDLTSRTPMRYILPAAHKDRVATLAFRSDGKLLVSGGYDGKIILWNPETRQMLGEPLLGHSGTVFSVAFSPSDQNVLATCGVDGTIRLWNVTERKLYGPPLIGHNGPVYSIDFSRDGKTLISGGYDAAVLLWDLSTPNRLAVPFAGQHRDSVKVLSFSPDGKILASGSYDSTIILWDTNTRRPLRPPLAGHRGTIFGMAFDPKGEVLASGGMDGSILIRRTTDYAISKNIVKEENDEKITGLAFSPKNSLLVTGSDGGTITFREAQTGTPIGDPVDIGEDYWPVVCFSPDGKTLAYGANTGRIALLDSSSHRQIGTVMKGHSEAVDTIAFSPDGETLASGGTTGSFYGIPRLARFAANLLLDIEVPYSRLRSVSMAKPLLRAVLMVQLFCGTSELSKCLAGFRSERGKEFLPSLSARVAGR